jgi:hypothetical protein
LPPRIDFLIAGVQKGGTSALHAFLSRHPRIFLPRVKELHLFDDESVDWKAPDYRRLERHFAAKHPLQIAGDATPIYSYWRPSAGRIQRYNPNIRMILLLRNPVLRAYAHWAMEVSRNNDQLTFREAIRGGRRRVTQDAEIAGCHRIFSYVERGFYGEQIDRLLKFFSPDQILFVKTEDLWNRHVETLDGICDFLGQLRFPRPPEREYIATVERPDVPPLAASDAIHLMNLYRDDIARTARLTGLDLTNWIESPPA